MPPASPNVSVRDTKCGAGYSPAADMRPGARGAIPGTQDGQEGDRYAASFPLSRLFSFKPPLFLKAAYAPSGARRGYETELAEVPVVSVGSKVEALAVVLKNGHRRV